MMLRTTRQRKKEHEGERERERKGEMRKRSSSRDDRGLRIGLDSCGNEPLVNGGGVQRLFMFVGSKQSVCEDLRVDRPASQGISKTHKETRMRLHARVWTTQLIVCDIAISRFLFSNAFSPLSPLPLWLNSHLRHRYPRLPNMVITRLDLLVSNKR